MHGSCPIPWVCFFLCAAYLEICLYWRNTRCGMDNVTKKPGQWDGVFDIVEFTLFVLASLPTRLHKVYKVNFYGQQGRKTEKHVAATLKAQTRNSCPMLSARPHEVCAHLQLIRYWNKFLPREVKMLCLNLNEV